MACVKHFIKAEFVHIKNGIFAFSKRWGRFVSCVALLPAVRVLFLNVAFGLWRKNKFGFLFSQPCEI